ncbi:hypothetical protein BJ138DRAFT_1116361 [Hygrophoropsis aurantiaca]|uniref:Uncharacterized protein n=1 Tax=Hygrophoropsis aurantiaca TaxID=72124 RepID=A0ACB8A301_9AGAM|nr:hypothetical protein BJ138DRAFT_1116361 [Hygrophoropsis aurantiaca]
MAAIPMYDFSAEEPELYGRQQRTPRPTERMQVYIAEREKQNMARDLREHATQRQHQSQILPHTPTTNFSFNQTDITNGPNSAASQTQAYIDMNRNGPVDHFTERNITASNFHSQQWSQHQPNFAGPGINEHAGPHPAQVLDCHGAQAPTAQSPDPAQEPLDHQTQWNASQQMERAAGEAERQPDFNSPGMNATIAYLCPKGAQAKKAFFCQRRRLVFYTQTLIRDNDPGTVSPSSGSPILSSPTPAGKENRPADASILVPGSKRVRDSDNPVSSSEEMGPSRTKVSKSQRNKATESDLAPMELKICKRAYAYHRCLLSTENPLPDPETTAAEVLAIKAYSSALEDLSALINPGLLSPFKDPSEVVVNILSQRGSTLRGKVVTTAKNLVAAMYNIEKPGAESNNDTVNHIREQVASLVDRGAYVYRDPVKRTGLYCHPIILEILCRVWFKEKSKSDGVRYANTYFNVDGKGIPLATIALITTAVRCALDEWLQGTYTETHFKCDKYLKIYRKELQTLVDWDKYTTNTGSRLAAKLRVDLFEKARAYAGDTTASNTDTTAISVDDFAANENQL